MFIPFVTSRPKSKQLERRKGGGHGHTGHHGGGDESKNGRASIHKYRHPVHLPASTTNGRATAIAYGAGGGSAIVISAGEERGVKFLGRGGFDPLTGSRNTIIVS